VAKLPNLTADEEQALGRRIQAGDAAARNELVQRNYGYVRKAALRFAYCCDVEDMKQEMFLGLVEAAGKYDPDRGCKFLTIASHYVKKYALSYLSQRNIVFVPTWIRTSQPRTVHSTRRAKARYDQAAAAAEIAKRAPLYLGAYPNDGDEILGAERESNPRASVHNEVHAALAQLSSFEESVVCSRFGIGCKRETTKVLAKRFDVHPQKIVRTRNRALRKLHGLLRTAS
jgi:RNA polymerase primary sigma factor